MYTYIHVRYVYIYKTCLPPKINSVPYPTRPTRLLLQYTPKYSYIYKKSNNQTPCSLPPPKKRISH